MKNYYLLLALAFLLFLPMVNAEMQSLGTFKQNSCVNLIQTCDNCTYVNITSIKYPNSSSALGLSAMTKSGTLYNYSFCSTSVIGNYIVSGIGDLDGELTSWNYDFNINGLGEELTQARINFYIAIIAILFFFLILCLAIIKILPSEDDKDDSGNLISINWLKFIRYPLWAVSWGMLVFISYLIMGLGESYFSSPVIGQIFLVIFTILLISAIIGIPLIFWFMFSKFIKDRVIDQMLKRGLFD